jgi:hypothetical protein
MNPCVILDDNQVIRLKNSVPTDCELTVWLGDWLSHLGIFSDAQIYDVLRFVGGEIEAWLKLSSKPHFSIVISDSRWVSVQGKLDFWDAKLAAPSDKLGQYALTHIMCDIGILYARGNKRKKQA